MCYGVGREERNVHTIFRSVWTDAVRGQALQQENT